ncbi:MAG: zinc ribbon domain-containing protein [Verrucomicrobiota bacterium JB022]|nr:zinc ribbon domain-containing protein [Verrucomicrobiota bacterium JB022]
MPLYEYTCQSCDHAFEALVQGSQSQPSCPSCGSAELAKKWSTFAPSMGSGASAPAMPPCACGNMPGMCGLN